MSGPAWDAVLQAADEDTSKPDVADQNDLTNVRVLAAAIVFARNANPAYRDKVIAAIEVLVNRGHPGGRTLAWGREVGAYACAADLVGYRTAPFEAWLTNLADVWLCGQLQITLRAMFERRPNNWGSMAFGTLCAIYRYLGSTTDLTQIRDYWIQAVTGPNPGLSYGNDLSWHPDPGDLRWINPAQSAIQGFDVEGIIADDMRRGDSFQVPPVHTGYPWEHLQGLVLAARILERAGEPIWDVDNQAILRATHALQVRLETQFGGWAATGDDLWQLAFFDDAYGTTWSAGQNVWGSGKNTGWAYVLVPRTAAPEESPSPPADGEDDHGCGALGLEGIALFLLLRVLRSRPHHRPSAPREGRRALIG